MLIWLKNYLKCKCTGLLFYSLLVWLQMLKVFSDELVPLIIPAKSGGTQAVRLVLTSSKEDKDMLEVVNKYQFLLIIKRPNLA